MAQPDPFAPVWRGTTGVTERLGSPVVEFSDLGVKATRVYDGVFTYLLANTPSVGSVMPDMGNLQVERVRVTPTGGGAGTMTVLMKMEGIPALTATQVPVYETEWVEVQKDILRHPRYQPGGVDAL